jgi:hypothetical protein
MGIKERTEVGFVHAWVLPQRFGLKVTAVLGLLCLQEELKVQPPQELWRDSQFMHTCSPIKGKDRVTTGR